MNANQVAFRSRPYESVLITTVISPRLCAKTQGLEQSTFADSRQMGFLAFSELKIPYNMCYSRKCCLLCTKTG